MTDKLLTREEVVSYREWAKFLNETEIKSPPEAEASDLLMKIADTALALIDEVESLRDKAWRYDELCK